MNAEQLLEKHINAEDLNFIYHEKNELYQEIINALNGALNKADVIGSLRFTANDVDGAYFIGVFNSGGIDRLSEELERIKKLGIMPHQMLDIMKRS